MGAAFESARQRTEHLRARGPQSNPRRGGDAPSLVCFKLLARRLALIKEARRISPSQPEYRAAAQFMGWNQRAGGAAIAPTLSAHVADQIEQESAVARESQNACREAIARGGGKDLKGGKGDSRAAAHAADDK